MIRLLRKIFRIGKQFEAYEMTPGMLHIGQVFTVHPKYNSSDKAYKIKITGSSKDYFTAKLIVTNSNEYADELKFVYLSREWRECFDRFECERPEGYKKKENKPSKKKNTITTRIKIIDYNGKPTEYICQEVVKFKYCKFEFYFKMCLGASASGLMVIMMFPAFIIYNLMVFVLNIAIPKYFLWENMKKREYIRNVGVEKVYLAPFQNLDEAKFFIDNEIDYYSRAGREEGKKAFNNKIKSKTYLKYP